MEEPVRMCACAAAALVSVDSSVEVCISVKKDLI
jgi:hypothetical protein